MKKLVRNRSQKHGLPPGTPVFISDRPAVPSHITLIDFDRDHAEDIADAAPAACIACKNTPSISWINVNGLGDGEIIKELAEGFGLHPLVQEDILNLDQRPKADDYDDYLYLVLKMLRWDSSANEITSEQISLVVFEHVVITFQEKPGDVFEPVRQRIRSGKGRIRNMPAGYLAYCLIDAIVDGYFDILENMGDKIEAMEQSLIANPTPDMLKKIHHFKRENLHLRKSVWPLREVIGSLQRNESPLIGESVSIYLRDLYDHTIHVIDTVDAFRDILGGMLDIYLSSVSNRMNEVMKVLTIMASIFIPLTFIAGVYGMNFKHMPELDWPWAYPAALGMMAVVAGVMLLFFKRKKWL